MNACEHCTYHPEIDAVAGCASCNRPFCQACLVEIGGKHYCRPCAQLVAGSTKQGASDMAIASLILSVASLAFCGLSAIPGMIIGYMELGKINRGESPDAGRGIAKAGAIIGTVMTALLLLSVLVAIMVIIVGIIIAVLAGS